MLLTLVVSKLSYSCMTDVEVSDSPVDAGLVESDDFIPKVADRLRTSFTLEEIELDLKTQIEKLKRRYPGREALIDSHGLILGLSAFHGTRIEGGRLVMSPEDKEHSARTQQYLAHAWSFATSEQASLEYARRIYRLFYGMEKLSEDPYRRGERLRGFLEGIKAETAIISVLKAAGYDVFIPNYGFSSKPLDNQIIGWDLKGVDMIALLPKEHPDYDKNNPYAVMIDSKGSRNSEEATSEPIISAHFTKLSQSLQEFFRKRLNRLSKIVITVPSRLTNFSFYPSPSKEDEKGVKVDYKQRLKDVLELNPEDEEFIIDAVKQGAMIKNGSRN